MKLLKFAVSSIVSVCILCVGNHLVFASEVEKEGCICINEYGNKIEVPCNEDTDEKCFSMIIIKPYGDYYYED